MPTIPDPSDGVNTPPTTGRSNEPDYMDLVATARRAGLSDRPRPFVYMLHRTGCTRVGGNARPLTEYAIGPEVILRNVRHSINAGACAYCKPDPAPRVVLPPGGGDA